jgi:two-component system, NtrC family, sensor histidine kinase KinB
MKIKTKLFLGIGLLFLMISALTIIGTVNIDSLKNDTDNILSANYNSLDYCRNMLFVLDEDIKQPKVLSKLLDNLKKQQNNITEIGEKEATLLLTEHFELLNSNPNDSLIYKTIRNDISQIMMLNMQAIQHKSNIAKTNAKSATIWMSIAGTLCFLIAVTLLFNLPGNIGNPIKELTESVKEIADKNYSQRVYYHSNDEFGELAKSFNTMAEKLLEYDNINLSKLLYEKKRIEALINSMRDPVIGLDENMKILFANDEALKITGLKSGDIIAKSAKDIALSNDLIRLLIQGLLLHKDSTEQYRKEPVKIFVDNKESYFEKEFIEILIKPTGETMKKHIGDVIILKNITPFKELDLAKTNFIATISHELKTPVSSIKMSLHLLENKKGVKITEEQKQLFQSIDEDSNRILKIISELLKLTQAETGNIQLTMKQSNPLDILNYSLDTIKVQAEQSQINFDIKVDEDLPKVKADTEKTAWVLINILSNAVRYSPEKSSILIELKKENDRVLFSIKDNGKGIESRYLDKLFDKYFQVPGSGKSGTGLGLAISKEFIEGQGGEIGVESEIGLGSRFYFYLKT